MNLAAAFPAMVVLALVPLGAHLRFFYRPLVSLTPCFSWVLLADPVGVNRFNGFEGTDFGTCARLPIRTEALKPLKRLTLLRRFSTPS